VPSSRVKQSVKSIFRLLNPEDKGVTIFDNVNTL
jgi:hypothetical protein